MSENLCEINPRYSNIILDNFMAEAINSLVVSRLFTQGRHRNASVILLLQNISPKTTASRQLQKIQNKTNVENTRCLFSEFVLFCMSPKGKYNMDISRHTQYLALYRGPSNRKQTKIIGERMFDKNRVHFIDAFYKKTGRLFGYLSLDCNLTHQPIAKFLQTYSVNAMFITSV